MKVFVSELVFGGWHKLIEDSLHERLWLEAVKMPAYPDDFWTGIVWRSVGQKFSVNKLEEEKLNILRAAKSEVRNLDTIIII